MGSCTWTWTATPLRRNVVAVLLLSWLQPIVADIWCYSCVSNQPGCVNGVNWYYHHAITCPREDDKCVKIIERKGDEVLYTRDCLSNLEPFRHDIPADTYEGCRPAAESPKLAVYVENNIKEYELKRDYYDRVDYCFCEFWHWCNSSTKVTFNLFLAAGLTLFLLFLNFGMQKQP